jgi:hypothetical protein
MSTQKIKQHIQIFKGLTNRTHHIINIYIYLYYMHIKYYHTHPKNIELKGMSDERLENPIENH